MDYAKLFRKENAVDINRLEHEALTPPLLLADWSEHLNNEYRALLLLEQQMTKLKTELELFYSGKHPDDEVYKNKKVYGVDIRNLKLVKVQIQQYIGSKRTKMVTSRNHKSCARHDEKLQINDIVCR